MSRVIYLLTESKRGTMTAVPRYIAPQGGSSMPEGKSHEPPRKTKYRAGIREPAAPFLQSPRGQYRNTNLCDGSNRTSRHMLTHRCYEQLLKNHKKCVILNLLSGTRFFGRVGCPIHLMRSFGGGACSAEVRRLFCSLRELRTTELNLTSISGRMTSFFDAD